MAKSKRTSSAIKAAPVSALKPVFEPVHVSEHEFAHERAIGQDPMLKPVVRPEPVIEPEPVIDPGFEHEHVIEPELKPILDPVPEPEPVLGPVPEPEPVPEPAEPLHIGPVHEKGETKMKISDFQQVNEIPELRFIDKDGKAFRLELHSSGVYWLYPV